MEFLYEYGLFLAKSVTLIVTVAIIITLIVGASAKPKASQGELVFSNISNKLADQKVQLLSESLSKDEFKKYQKEQKKAQKQPEKKPRVFVLSFDGGVAAKEVEALRKEVTAILQIAQDEDEVLLKLESGGGVVHGYGLAASQLARLKNANVKLTVTVDKVAASGGYMMACVSDKLVCAPFAIIGSIGVIAQLPNFNKVLKKNDVEFEQITAGEYKRTLTMFGENTDSGRDKFKQEIEQIHSLFRDHVELARPQLDISKVSTGETWFGHDALKIGLVDDITTSDDLILQLNDTHELFSVSFKAKKALSEKFGLGAAAGVESIVNKLVVKSKELYH